MPTYETGTLSDTATDRNRQQKRLLGLDDVMHPERDGKSAKKPLRGPLAARRGGEGD